MGRKLLQKEGKRGEEILKKEEYNRRTIKETSNSLEPKKEKTPTIFFLGQRVGNNLHNYKKLTGTTVLYLNQKLIILDHSTEEVCESQIAAIT